MVIGDLREHAHFLEIVADRIWHAFWQDSGRPPSYIIGRVRESLGPDPIPMALVVHAGGEFLGTASVIVSDEDARPNLSPWIAAVWVEPHARNRGVGAALVEHAAQAAFALGHDALYLGASTRRRSFYEKRGWRAHEEDVPRPGMAILTRGRP